MCTTVVMRWALLMQWWRCLSASLRAPAFWAGLDQSIDECTALLLASWRFIGNQKCGIGGNSQWLLESQIVGYLMKLLGEQV